MPTQRGLWDVPSIVSTIDFDLESDSFSDFGPANGRTPMCQPSV